MLLCDMHTHTRLSSDADQSKDNNTLSLCESAWAKGIKHIAVTEHFDIIPDPGAITCDFEQSKNEVLEAKERYKGRLDVMLGTELAHMNRTECQEAGNKVLSDKELDFVIGSFHILSDGTDYYTMDFSQYSDAELLRSLDSYLEELHTIAKTCDFDSLAHATYPLRYYHMHGRLGIVDMKIYNEAYAEIFKTLIKREKCLEINSSTLRGEYGEPLPCYNLVKLYADMGGKMFTLGSDGHHYSLVGTKIYEVQEYLINIGIKGIYTYHKRNPEFQKFG